MDTPEDKTMLIGKLNVVCKTYTAKGTKKPLTDMTVRMGNMVIATRTSAGKWTEADALKELKRFPERFKLADGWNLDQLKAVAA
jgi:hypothetical protein